MGPEANINSIRALEKQIKEGKGDIIKLKRDRNSLLNISTRVPPEILGDIFSWNLVRKRRFQGLRKGSYNFLLVCHHWFEVASNTPELWGFWGNTLQDWKKCHHRSGAAPLDLVLEEVESNPGVLFDESLRDAIRSRVVQNTIRQVHLSSNDHDILTSIISSLTPDGEGGRNENIESILLETDGFTTLDVSNFFIRSLLPRLRSLDLYGRIRISSWNRLAPKNTLLTALSLNIDMSPSLPAITAAQLFSILVSNPKLQKLSLSRAAIPNDADTSTFKAQLPNLYSLTLAGGSRRIFGLLRQLVLQEALDDMLLSGSNSTAEDVSQTLAPYMQDYFQRDPRFHGRLGVSFPSSPGVISISIGVVHTRTTMVAFGSPWVSLRITTNLTPSDTLDRLFVSLTTLIPKERVVSFKASFNAWPPEEVFFVMPYIEVLHLSHLPLSEGFLQPNPHGPHANRKLFPSLRSLCLEDVVFQNKDDWSHLVTYLAHQTSDGQTISLKVVGNFPRDCPEIMDGIRSLVKDFTHR